MIESPKERLVELISSLKFFRLEPKQFNSLSEIRLLNFSHCNLEGLPPGIDEMVNLEELDLSGNRLFNVDEIWHLKTLKKVFLFANKIAYISPDVKKLHLLEELNLGSNDLSIIPEEIGLLQKLKLLSLSANNFKTIPASIGTIKTLENLRLSQIPELDMNSVLEAFSNYHKPIRLGNFGHGSYPNEAFLQINVSSIDALSEKIGIVSSLMQLHFPNSRITGIPNSIGELSKLAIINLKNNRITQLPTTIGKLASLTILDLNGNNLIELPDSIGLLSNLKQLWLYGNKIHLLPSSICNLHALEVLDLSENGISELPENIGSLSNLTELNLTGNKLKRLPDSIKYLTNLKKLWLVNNDMPEIEREKIKVLLPDCFILFEPPQLRDQRVYRPPYNVLKKGLFVRYLEEKGCFEVKDKTEKIISVCLRGKQRLYESALLKFKKDDPIYINYDTRTTQGRWLTDTDFKLDHFLFAEKLLLDKDEGK